MKRIILSIILILIFNTLLYPVEKKISVMKCIDIALQNHPDLFVSGESEKKSFFQYKIAKSISDIQIDGQLKTTERLKADGNQNSAFNVPGRDTDIGLFAGLTAKYSLYDPQKISREEVARINIDITKIDSIKIKNNIIYNVKEAYYNYLLSQAQMNFNKEHMGQFKLKQKQAKIEFESGVKSVLGITKANIILRKSKLKFERSKNFFHRSKLKLYSSMGIKTNNDFDILPEKIKTLPRLKFMLDELYKLADIYSPSIRKVNFEKKLSKIKILTVQSLHYPRVNFTFLMGYENLQLRGINSFSDNFSAENWTPTFLGFISASLPVYTGGRISSEVKSSESDYNIIIYKRRNIIIKVRNSIQNIFNNINELLKQIEISKLILEDSKKHLLFARNNYESGIGAQSEQYNAEISVLQSGLELLQVKQDYLIAIAKLANIIGVTEGFLCRK